MADVTHVADEHLKGPDESLETVAQLMAARERGLRLRVSIQLWNGEDYVSWKGQVWKLELLDTGEARETQQAMEAFFDFVSARGADATRSLLENALVTLPGDGRGRDQGEEQTSGTQHTNTAKA